MCMDCWKEHGSPTVYNSKVKRAIQLINNVYEYHGAGGALHIVIDDWNVGPSFIHSCVEYAKEYFEKHKNRLQFNTEIKCAKWLLKMTDQEIYSALARQSYPEYFKGKEYYGSRS